MAVEYDANGTPILTNDSLISDVPPYTQALAATGVGGGGGGGAMPIGTIIPWALPLSAANPGSYDLYDNVEKLAPGFLPCTGGVYPRERAPELCDAIGHIYIESSVTQEAGVVFSGVNGDAWSGHKETGVYRMPASLDIRDAVEITDDGFVVPDLRGRSPIGATNKGGWGTDYEDDPVRSVKLGKRLGDRRVGEHTHLVSTSNPYAAVSRQSGSTLNTVYLENGSWNMHTGSADNILEATSATNAVRYHGNDLDLYQRSDFASGRGYNHHPCTTINFLIYCGVDGSAAPIEEIHMVTKLCTVEF